MDERTRIYNSVYYQKHRDKMLNQNKLNYKKNKEKILEKKRKKPKIVDTELKEKIKTLIKKYGGDMSATYDKITGKYGKNNLIVVKKYENRKLYCSPYYIIHEDLVRMLQEGYNVVVIDKKTKEDITIISYVNALSTLVTKYADQINDIELYKLLRGYMSKLKVLKDNTEEKKEINETIKYEDDKSDSLPVGEKQEPLPVGVNQEGFNV